MQVRFHERSITTTTLGDLDTSSTDFLPKIIEMIDEQHQANEKLIVFFSVTHTGAEREQHRLLARFVANVSSSIVELTVSFATAAPTCSLLRTRRRILRSR